MYYLAHVIEQPNFQILNPQYFVYLLDQTVGQDILQFIYSNHVTHTVGGIAHICFKWFQTTEDAHPGVVMGVK